MPTFYQRVQESARKFPDNIALEIQRQQTVERVTFAELTRMSESVANWLSRQVPRHARVAILAANHPRWVAAYLGIIAGGRTAVPLDTAFQPDQVKKLLVDSGASLLFCDAKHLAVAAEATDGLDIRLVMTSATAEQNLSPQTGKNPFAADLDSIFAGGPAGFQPVVPRRATSRRCSILLAPPLIPRVSCSPTPISWAKRIPSSASSRSTPRMRCWGFCPCFTSSRKWRISFCLYSTGRASYTWKRSTPPNCCAPCRNAISPSSASCPSFST